MATSKKTETVETGELVTTGSAAIAEHREQLQQLITKAISEMKQTDFDAEQQMFDILEAETVEDLLNSASVLHLKDIIGTPMTVHGATLQDSTYEQSMLPMYAVMRVEFDDGTRALVTTGATQVVAAMVAAQAKGFFPFRCASSSVTTGGGFDVIKLVNAPARSR